MLKNMFVTRLSIIGKKKGVFPYIVLEKFSATIFIHRLR